MENIVSHRTISHFAFCFLIHRTTTVLSRNPQTLNGHFGFSWHGDGTFKSAPTFFAKNFLMHGWLNAEMWPCVFILTPDRQNKNYKKILRELIAASTSPQ